MIRYLLDVSVLLALHWPRHTAHVKAMQWFHTRGERSFSTCAITQAGFVRIVTNPTFLEDKITHEEARQLLDDLTHLHGHVFWDLDVGFLEATAPLADRILGHRQVTDAYLLGLAIHRKGTLATLDRAVRHLAGSDFARHLLVIE
ncbi:MAG TPA: TA system VapC family ribonuclease toxin [Alloacidobacterium sp.]|nr:TA system VapC family ribonuclease toxin [Alloacidobacterium sp.]